MTVFPPLSEVSDGMRHDTLRTALWRPDAAAAEAGWWADLAAHMVAHGPLFLIGLTPQGRVIAVNDAGCRITGYSRETFFSSNYWELLYPGELAHQVDTLLADFSGAAEVRDYPMTLATRNGGRRVIAWSSLNRHAPDGSLREIIGLGVDITMAAEHTQALIRTEARLAEAQRVAHLGTWELDVVHDRLWWSDEAQALLDLGPDAPATSYPGFLARVHEDDRTRVDSAYREALARHTDYDIVYRVRTRDGHVKSVHGHCRNEYDADGRPLRSVGTVQDITALLGRQAALLDQLTERVRLAEYTEHVVANTPAFVFAVAPDGTTRAINEAGCRLLGCARRDIIGRNLWRAMYPGALYEQVPRLFAAFARDGGVADYEMHMRAASGEERVLSWTSANRFDDDGNVIEIIGIGHDLTELRRNQELLREAQEIAGLGGWEYDLTSGRLNWSDEALCVLEITRDEIGETLDDVLALVDAGEREEVARRYRESLGDTGLVDLVFRIVTPRRQVKHLRARWRNSHDADGQAVRSAGTIQDITGEVEQQAKLTAALDETVRMKAYHEHVVENSPAVVMATTPSGVLTAVNEAGCRILGYAREDIIGHHLWSTLCPGDKYAQVEAMFREYERGSGLKNFEMVIENARGEERVWSWNSVNRLDADGNLLEAVGIANDITELKRSQTELQYLAHHDPLTGLPNRLLLCARLEHAIEQTHRRRSEGALLFIDIDRFKNINDSLGHPIGDALLQFAAQRLQGCVRRTDTVARLSGDEFTLLLEDIDGPEAAVQVAEKVLAAFSQPFCMEGHEIAVTPSIGISVFPRDGADIDSLLRNADSAMYEAKEKGRNAYAMYSQRMTEAALERVRLENDLRRALDNHELVVHYQSQVELDSGRLDGAEALLRWNHPELGLVAPDRFIPLAEESGLIVPIGDWVLRTACHAARAWLDAGVALTRIAVNVAGPQIRRGRLPQAVAAALAEAELPASRLELEVTESFIMSEAEHAIDELDALRELGVSLSIDDFGTGYSSLSYLKRLPINQLKIDRSFVRDIPDDSDDMAITGAVIALAQSLRLETVAEGVESEAQRQFLLAQGCRHGQGYLFHKPMPAADFTAWALAQAHAERAHGQRAPV
ncbi:MAG: EAL domain-containing protein [Gammaproteobacteria bacterium]